MLILKGKKGSAFISSIVFLLPVAFYFLGRGHFLSVLGTKWCGGSDGWTSCSSVATSVWASFLGVPLSVYGFAYSILLVMALIAVRFDVRQFFKFFSPLQVLAGTISCGLIFIQIFVIKKICPACLALDVFFVLIGIMGLRNLISFNKLMMLKNALLALLVLMVGFMSKDILYGLWVPKISNLRTEEFLFEEVKKPTVLPELSKIILGDLKSSKTQSLLMILDPKCRFCAYHVTSLDDIGKHLRIKLEVDVSWAPADEACNDFMSSPEHGGACTFSKIFLCLDPQESGELLIRIMSRPALAHESLIPNLISSLNAGPGLNDCMARKKQSLEKQIQWSINQSSYSPVTWINGLKISGALNKSEWLSLLVK